MSLQSFSSKSPPNCLEGILFLWTTL